ncbi:carotenoid biosynthesis protein [Patescibacteria group bacterium]|nr:carotenoid biosynthesis protein [Patescibacteria group bacterium]
MAIKNELWVLGVGCGVLGLLGFMSGQAPLPSAFSWLPIISVVLLALPGYFAFVSDAGDKRGGAVLIMLALVGLGIEYIGVTTGWPYGTFAYSEVMGEKLFGVVPWTVAFAWPPLVLGALYAVKSINHWPLAVRALLAALLLVVIDLALDPAAVAQAFWTFTPPGPYYGVPWVNYAGWLLSGFIGSALALSVIKKSAHHLSWRTASSAVLSIAFFTGVNASYGLYVPMLVGLLLIAAFFFVQGKRFVRIYAHLAARKAQQGQK